jgi:MYXO-CTERM domain-containing protein
MKADFPEEQSPLVPMSSIRVPEATSDGASSGACDCPSLLVSLLAVGGLLSVRRREPRSSISRGDVLRSVAAVIAGIPMAALAVALHAGPSASQENATANAGHQCRSIDSPGNAR